MTPTTFDVILSILWGIPFVAALGYILIAAAREPRKQDDIEVRRL